GIVRRETVESVVDRSRVFFFFSSRRRHTRCLSDWSSDVCSSDLSSCFERFQDSAHVANGARRGARTVGNVVERLDSDVAGIAVADRKSTRLNSSHLGISYAVFCLKKKKKKKKITINTSLHISQLK